MKNKQKAYFRTEEIILWCSSVGLIILAFLMFDRESYMTVTASLIGVTSLIFNAKGNPVGQFLMVVFSLLYGVISYSFAYYGEMITYLGMTMPMAVVVYLTIKRSPYYAVAYAANDIVLIVLWSLASIEEIRYLSVVVCFAAFFANDIYGFVSWRRMEKRQNVIPDNAQET